MGNGYTKINKAVLYQWSTSEFPQEYAFIYTSLDDESKSSAFRFSVNRYKVLCRHVDNTCKHHPVRFCMNVTAERDSNNGDYKFGHVSVAANGIQKNPTIRNNYVFLSYHCEERGGSYMVNSYLIDQNMGHGNFMRTTTWEICHTFYTSSRTELRTYVVIQCNKVTGLCMRFYGPFIYKGVIAPEQQGFLIPRKVFGEPPKEFNEDVESDQSEEICIVLQQGNNNVNNVGDGTTLPKPSSVQATGLINNTGATLDLSDNLGVMAKKLRKGLKCQLEGLFVQKTS